MEIEMNNKEHSILSFSENKLEVEMDNKRLELEEFVRTDNKDGFASFLRSHREKFLASDVLRLVCSHHAVGCTLALLEGKAGLSIDVNVALEDGLFPLHIAAQSLSGSLTKLFLRRGDQTKISILQRSKDPAKLPINVALKALCHNQYVKDWTPKSSIFKLFYIFCLKELNEALDTIKLLASSTEDIGGVCFRCIEEGNVVQLTALLMVARDKLMVSCAEGGLENTPVMQYIMRELRASDLEIISSSVCSSPNSLMPWILKLRKRKINLLAAQDVVTALWRALDALEDYRSSSVPERACRYKVPYKVAYHLFSRAGLLLKPSDVYCDDIECFLAKLSPEHEAQLNEAIEKQRRSRSLSRNFLVEEPTSSVTRVSPPSSMANSTYRAFLSRISQVKTLLPKDSASSWIGTRVISMIKRIK